MRSTVGTMDQRITLQRRVLTPDGAGGEAVSWLDLDDNPRPWAHVIAKSGRETMTEGRMAASFVVLFTIYNRCDVDETCRILWQGAAYNIRGIRRESSRDLRLVIEAERGVAS